MFFVYVYNVFLQIDNKPVSSKEFNWQKTSIALDNGLVPNRRQAIT